MKNWKEEKYFYLHDIALLMLGHDPDKFNAAKLLQTPPLGFERIYRDIRLAACNHFINDYEKSEEVDEEYILVYELRTNKVEDKKQLTPQDGMEVSAHLKDIVEWINAKKKQNPNFEDKFFTPAHTVKAEQEPDLGQRERSSLYRIIGAFRHLVRNHPASEKGKPLFTSDTELIVALENQYKDFGEGISKTNLTKIFPEANKLMGLGDD